MTISKHVNILLSVLLCQAIAFEGACQDSKKYTSMSATFKLTEEELERYSREALHGSAPAAKKVADYYWKFGSKEEEKYWTLIAAENGDLPSQHSIGLLYYKDANSTPRERQRSLYWLRLAVEHGLTDTIDDLERATKELTRPSSSAPK